MTEQERADEAVQLMNDTAERVRELVTANRAMFIPFVRKAVRLYAQEHGKPPVVVYDWLDAELRKGGR